MPSLATLAYWELVALLAGFAGVILWQFVSGRISLAFLLEGDIRNPDGSGFTTEASPARVQALVVTLFVAIDYLSQVIRNPTRLPPISPETLAALAGSQVVYLGAKARALLFGSLTDVRKRR